MQDFCEKKCKKSQKSIDKTKNPYYTVIAMCKIAHDTRKEGLI